MRFRASSRPDLQCSALALRREHQHRHRADDSVNKAVGKLIRADLIIVDLCRYRDYADIVVAAGLNAPGLLGFSPVPPARLSA
jgi:hypothetical protein